MSRQSFYYSDAPYVQTLQGLYKALLSQEALVRLTGLPQTGKSTLCEKLMLYMQHKDYRVVYFRYAVESPDMLRTLLARELDLPNTSNFARMLEDVPLNSSAKPLILLFDDAHLLSHTTLLEIFRLMQVQSGAARKLNIVLCGEPLLEQRLSRRPELKSLMMHISHSFALQPMANIEMPGFVLTYMQKAGLEELQLDPAAMTYFYRATNGLPGAARTLCSALVAARRGSGSLDPVGKAELIELVRQTQESASGALPSGTQFRESNRWVVLGPVAIVVVIVSIGMLYQQLLGSRDANVADAATATSPIGADLDSPFAEAAEVDAAASLAEIVIPEVNTIELETGAIAAPIVAEPAVSDSDLVLVSAAQRGVAQAEIVEPVFDEVTAAEPSADVAVNTQVEVIEQAIVADSPLPDSALVLPTPVPPLAPELQPEAVQEIETAPVEITATIPTPASTVPATAGATISLAEIAPQTTAVAASQDFIESSSLTVVQALERDVSRWIAAWQEQNLEDYFASYHAQFVPRYHDSRQRWQQDRSRVIGNARSITLAMTEFEILISAPERVEVQFWLDYASPTYADSTQKKLVLAIQDGRWLILEEINLQVRS